MHSSSSAIQTPTAAAAISGHLDTRTAATEVAHLLHEQIGSTTGALLVFGSFHHGAAFNEAIEILRATVNPDATIGATAESVLGDDRELAGTAGLSAIALSAPNTRFHAWHTSTDDDIVDMKPAAVAERIGFGPDSRGCILLADPYTTRINETLEVIDTVTRARRDGGLNFGGGGRDFCLVGGLASGASQPGINLLVKDDEVFSRGAVGLTIAGDVAMDAVVSQGCRPIASPMLVTKHKENVILELGGRRATDVVRELAAELSDKERMHLTRGLFVGRVIDEYKPRFGRGDFVVRNVIGLSDKLGGVAVAEDPRAIKVGQTIQFHVRDAETATEDLELLLDAEQLRRQPFGAILVSCNGRGPRLFDEPHHETRTIRRRLNEKLPLAGFFAAGEIGPIGDRTFVHGQTASVALLRSIHD